MHILILLILSWIKFIFFKIELFQFCKIYYKLQNLNWNIFIKIIFLIFRHEFWCFIKLYIKKYTIPERTKQKVDLQERISNVINNNVLFNASNNIEKIRD